MIATGDSVSFTIAFMTGGVFLTVIFFAAAALVVVGYFKPSAKLRRAGWIVLAVWILPAAIWCYYLLVLTDHDRYRTLSKPEVLYGVPLPAGAYEVELWHAIRILADYPAALRRTSSLRKAPAA